jgi:hypothetical protein
VVCAVPSRSNTVPCESTVDSVIADMLRVIVCSIRALLTLVASRALQRALHARWKVDPWRWPLDRVRLAASSPNSCAFRTSYHVQLTNFVSHVSLAR